MGRTLIFRVLIMTMACYPVMAQQNRIDSLRKVLRLQTPGKAHIDVLNKLAFAYTPVSVTDAELITKQSLQESRDHNYEAGTAEAYKILGVIYYNRGEYNLAAQYSYESLNLYEKLEDRSGQGKVLNNLSLIFLAEQDYKKVKELSEQSLAIKHQEGDSVGVATSYLALAEYNLHQGNYEHAMQLCLRAHEMYRRADDWRICYAYFQIGEIYHEQKNYSLAKRYYRDAVQHATTAKDYGHLITVYKKFGQLYLQTGSLDSAYAMLHTARKLAINKVSRNGEMQANQLLAEYFTVTGKLDSALYYTNVAMAIEREIFNHQKSEQIAMMQMLYNFEKKDQELAFQKKIVRRQYVAIIGVCLILLCTVLLGVKFYKLNQYNRQAKDALLKLNEEINKMNENLETIVQERTEKIKFQNQKLIEFTFFTAHEVRGPVARILGLIELSKLDGIADDEKIQILQRLEEAGNELDEVIRQINRKMEKGQQLIL